MYASGSSAATHMGGPLVDPMAGHHSMSAGHGGRSRSLRRSMGDVPPFGPGGSPSKPTYINSISQPPSARGSPIGIGTRGMMSPTSRHRTARHPYGVSRSSNNSPLTLPMEHLPQSLSTSSAYGHGFPYYDDPGSPIDLAGRGMHRMSRRPPLRSYHSIEREPGYRDRSFDRMADPLTGRTHRTRDRSLDRALYPRDDLHQTHHSAYGRDPLLLDDPTLGGYGRDPLQTSTAGRNFNLTGTSGMSTMDPRAPYGTGAVAGGTNLIGGGRMGTINDNFVMELQARLNELQNQFGSVKRELDATTQKLGSSMHSIKTFWSPELKKERALRKEEAAKYALINDQLKILRSENQVRTFFSYS